MMILKNKYEFFNLIFFLFQILKCITSWLKKWKEKHINIPRLKSFMAVETQLTAQFVDSNLKTA